jgi:tRNA dimethylallyltransferase
MNSSANLLPLIVIAGPTASGKSALALALSRDLPVTLINADASQVYTDLRVVTARPSVIEMSQAPHRLFGHIDGAVSCSAADWAAQATQAIAQARAAWRMPVLVGGTGLYLRTLLDGIAPVPEIDPAVRAEVRAMPVRAAFALLTREDPAAAARLSGNDTTRVARALEVVRATGRPLADWHKERVGGLGESVKTIGMILLPPREWLSARCDARFEAMMGEEGTAEVRALIARNLSPDLPVMRAIGVSAIAGLICGALSREDALLQGQLATRQYAKRQYTWFRNQPPAQWDRIVTQLNADNVNEFAIKLRQMALTS